MPPRPPRPQPPFPPRQSGPLESSSGRFAQARCAVCYAALRCAVLCEGPVTSMQAPGMWLPAWSSGMTLTRLVMRTVSSSVASLAAAHPPLPALTPPLPSLLACLQGRTPHVAAAACCTSLKRHRRRWGAGQLVASVLLSPAHSAPAHVGVPQWSPRVERPARQGSGRRSWMKLRMSLKVLGR